MKTFLKWLGLGLIMGILMVAVIAIWEREKVARLMAVNSLFSEERIVTNFTAMDTMFENVIVPSNPSASNTLNSGPPMDMPAGFETWTQDRAVTGIIVLQNGVIRHESYPLTAEDEDDPAMSRRISWSVAKSFLSTLMGILHEDGTIPDLDAQVTQYVPSLAGSAYDGASIKDVLQMSSGVTFDEDAQRKGHYAAGSTG